MRRHLHCLTAHARATTVLTALTLFIAAASCGGNGGGSSPPGGGGTGGSAGAGGRTNPPAGSGGSTGTGGSAGSGGPSGGGGSAGAGGAGGSVPKPADGGGSSKADGGGSKADGGGSKDGPAADGPNASNPAPLPACDKPNKGLDPSNFPISTLNCNSPGLVWKSANTTEYESNPAPGSDECIKFNGCFWAGKFNTCGDCLVKSKPWIASHHIISFYPLGNMGLHGICIKQGSKMVEAVVYDTCADSDCDGCCTDNRGNKDALLDIEVNTVRSLGLKANSTAQWADLGYKGASCTDAP